MRSIINPQHLAITMLSIALAGCGGSGGSGSDNNATNNQGSSTQQDQNQAINNEADSLWNSTDDSGVSTNDRDPNLDANNTQREELSLAINDEANSLWHLDEIRQEAAKNRSAQSDALAKATQSTLNYTFEAPPPSPVSRPGQLLNLPDPANKARYSITDRSWPDSFGKMNISLWSQDKLAAFSLTIDDNHTGDHHFWYEMADLYSWRWTWFIIANQVGWGPHDHWGHWQQALDKGHDVQTHTYSHLCDALFYTYREYRQSQAVINQNLNGAKVITMAYPFGIHSNKKGSPCASLDTSRTANSRSEAAKHFIAARDVYGALSNPAKIDYMKVPSISAARNFFNDAASWAYFDSILDSSSPNFRTWYSTHFHGVYGDKQKDEVRRVLAHIKSKESDVWVGTFTDVAQYAQEYATAKLSDIQVNNSSISFNLKDEMNDDWFDQPLTVKIRLPDNWQGSVNATQDGNTLNTNSVTNNGHAYALVDAVPDGGIVNVSF